MGVERHRCHVEMGDNMCMRQLLGCKCTCPKDNYLTMFINQMVDGCGGCAIYFFMDGFYGYNQINVIPVDQPKTTFICPWGTFFYQKLPLV